MQRGHSEIGTDNSQLYMAVCLALTQMLLDHLDELHSLHRGCRRDKKSVHVCRLALQYVKKSNTQDAEPRVSHS